jgi:hypothetical protein
MQLENVVHIVAVVYILYDCEWGGVKGRQRDGIGEERREKHSGER